jgi:hypothetical protein
LNPASARNFWISIPASSTGILTTAGFSMTRAKGNRLDVHFSREIVFMSLVTASRQCAKYFAQLFRVSLGELRQRSAEMPRVNAQNFETRSDRSRQPSRDDELQD